MARESTVKMPKHVWHAQLLVRTLSQEVRGSVTDPLLVAMRDRILPLRCARVIET